MKLSSVAVAALLLAACNATTIIYPNSGTLGSLENPTCFGSRLEKIHVSQDNYVQYIEYVATIPTLRAVSTCFWMSVENPELIATPLNYGLDEGRNTNNLTVQYMGTQRRWRLQVNDVDVYNVHAPLLVANRWTHLCHSWDGNTGVWSVWQDGALLEAGTNPLSSLLTIPGGGVMVTGQHQNTLEMGMDQGEGLQGSLTLLHVSSVPFPLPLDYTTQLAVRNLANDCSAQDRGDVIGWLRTPWRGYGGVTRSVAREQCRNF